MGAGASCGSSLHAIHSSGSSTPAASDKGTDSNPAAANTTRRISPQAGLEFFQVSAAPGKLRP